MSLLEPHFDGEVTSQDIARAHRLGQFSPSRCRPIIVKFANFKTREKVFSGRSKLSEHNIRVSEDLSLGTRQAHKTLIEFAKSQPNNPSFKLKYKKILLNGKYYSCDPVSGKVIESRHFPVAEASNHAPRNDNAHSPLPPPAASNLVSVPSTSSQPVVSSD